MSSEHAVSKIIWAVDPYLDNEESQARIVQALSALGPKLNATISPVSVIVSEDTIGFPPLLPAVPKELHSLVERRLETFLNTTKLPKLLAPIVLTQERVSIRESVDTVIRHAHEFSGDLIAVSTHSRKGAERFLTGSFAETLLLRSDIPTLSVGPHTNPIEQIEEILFPTDYSEKSLQVLERVKSLARSLGAKIHLFHHSDFFPSYYFPIDPTPASLGAMEKHEVWEKERGEALLKQVREGGNTATFTFSRDGASAVESILEFAKQMRPGIIAMASQSGAVGTVLLGSVARQVVRSAPWPVWVLHPGGRN